MELISSGPHATCSAAARLCSQKKNAARSPKVEGFRIKAPQIRLKILKVVIYYL